MTHKNLTIDRKFNASIDRVLPFPAMGVKISKYAVLNLSSSPAVDYGNQRNNAVLFFQYKLQLR